MENKKNEINKDIDQVSGGYDEGIREAESVIPRNAVLRGLFGIATRDPERFGDLGRTTGDMSEKRKLDLEAIEDWAHVVRKDKNARREVIDYLNKLD